MIEAFGEGFQIAAADRGVTDDNSSPACATPIYTGRRVDLVLIYELMRAGIFRQLLRWYHIAFSHL